jgi:hypothetical protein
MVGFRKPRKIRPKEKDLPKGYDSKWEHTLHETVLQDWEHHWELVPYIVKHKYEPDFVKKIKGTTILLEAKGRFWDYPEYSKYIHIRTALPKNTELVFLFQKPFAPMPGAKMRKDRTKRTHAEWAETNNFRWYSEDTLPMEWGNYEL